MDRPIAQADIERCRTLVAEIDELARQTGAYETQRHWHADGGGPVYDPARPLQPSDVTREFLEDLPSRASFFTGDPPEGTALNGKGRFLWQAVRRVSPLLAARIIARWWHRLTLPGRHRGPPLVISDMLAAAQMRRLPCFMRPPASFDGTMLDRIALADRLRALAAAGALPPLRERRSPVVLEIGAGYGGLAFALKHALPRATYVIVDLPDSLKLSACYLATRQRAPIMTVARLEGMARDGSFLLCPATAIDRLEVMPIDLAINTLSFGEMSEAQVGRYAAFLRRNLAPDAALFEQNFDNTHLGREHFCNPTIVLAQHFSRQRVLSGPYIKGTPRVWSA